VSPRTNSARRRSPAPRPGSPRPKLRLIDAKAMRREARGHRLVMIAIVGLSAAMLLIAGVQAKLVQSQRALDQKRIEITAVEARVAELERAVMSASSPMVVVESAESMGMVRSETPVYLVATGEGE